VREAATPYQLDQQRRRRACNQAAARYDQAAVLPREIGARLLERLDYVRLVPRVVVDVGCATGITAVPLLKRYRQAVVVALDNAPAMLAVARRRAPWFRRLRCVCGDAEALPLADASCDLVFSNLALHWWDLERTVAELRRVLRPGGLLLFSTLGPDTLMELRRSWAAADDYIHVHAFVDMHDVGDALVRAALADPVVDMERITLTYRDVNALMADLKTLGAGNVAAGRPPGLTGKGRFQAMRAAYEQYRTEVGLLPATFEVVYGHAWAPDKPLSQGRRDGSAVFSLCQLKISEKIVDKFSQVFKNA